MIDLKREKKKCYNMAASDDYSQLMTTNLNKSLSINLCFSDYVNYMSTGEWRIKTREGMRKERGERNYSKEGKKGQ